MRTAVRDLAGAALAALPLIVAYPEARAAARLHARSSVATTPVERAFTGGLATLRAPASRMIRVASGGFVMGSTRDDVLAAIASCGREPLGYLCSESSFSDEIPRHFAELPAFFLDRTEVTVQAYERCVSAGACAPRLLDSGARRLARAELPVTFVTAGEAENYCRFRGARLPTEAEFERAARGTHGRRFPWGDQYHSRRANHGRLGLDMTDAGDGFTELAPVGSFPSGRTPSGFLDLAGNAAEWTASAYTDRHGEPADPSWGGARVIRGGHFMNGGAWLRGAARERLGPDQQRASVGFRCARTAGRTGETGP